MAYTIKNIPSKQKLGGLLIFCCVCIFPVQAQPPQAKTSDLQLILQPSICVLENKQSRCRRTLSLQLTANISSQFCVYIKGNIETKQCYQAHQATGFLFAVNTGKSVMIIVEEMDEQQTIAWAMFKVAEYLPVKKRKRRRYSWTIL